MCTVFNVVPLTVSVKSAFSERLWYQPHRFVANSTVAPHNVHQAGARTLLPADTNLVLPLFHFCERAELPAAGKSAFRLLPSPIMLVDEHDRHQDVPPCSDVVFSTQQPISHPQRRAK